MTPSQQLDSYLSHHGGEAASSAPRAALPSPVPFTSLNTPTSRLPHLDANIEYPNTAASCVHEQQQQHHHPAAAETASWDGGATGDSLREDADVDVELRLAHAEDQLQKHSTLLSLFLDATSADHQLQQLELRGEEQEPEQQPRRHQQRSVAEVLERAEKGNTKGITNPSKSNKFHKDGFRSIKDGARTFTTPGLEAKGVSEESLLERLAHFDKTTARLKYEMSTKAPYTSSMLYSSNGYYTGRNARLDDPEKGKLELERRTPPPKTASCTSPGRKKEKSVSFIPARHTLKSSAAAVAIRKSLETTDDSDTENLIDDGRGGGGGGNDDGIERRNLRKAAALLKPRQGSTTALISEVAALRKRVAKSLACVEGSHWDTMNIGTSTGRDVDGGVGGYDVNPSLDI